MHVPINWTLLGSHQFLITWFLKTVWDLNRLVFD
jgi:hypothetical protein